MSPVALSRRDALTVGLIGGLVAACSRSGEPAPTGLARLDLPFLLGAYVDPPLYIDADRVRAFLDFEEALGHRLDLYHSYHPWEEPFPSAPDLHFARRGTRLLLSWGGTDTAAIAAGQYDALVAERATALRDLDRPVVLQWRWEMNRPNLAAEVRSGADYVAAWRRIHDVFADVGVPQVQWAWCPLVDELADPDFSAYFPGEDYVDLVGANGYARAPDQSFAEVFEPFFDWAAGMDRPILIGEFGRSAELGDEKSLADWLAAAGQTLLELDRVDAVCLFNNPRGASGDYDISDRPSALAAVRGWEA